MSEYHICIPIKHHGMGNTGTAHWLLLKYTKITLSFISKQKIMFIKLYKIPNEQLSSNSDIYEHTGKHINNMLFVFKVIQ